jgi:hypothetical protein
MRSVKKSYRVYSTCLNCDWTSIKTDPSKEKAKQHAWKYNHKTEHNVCHVSTYNGAARNRKNK